MLCWVRGCLIGRSCKPSHDGNTYSGPEHSSDERDPDTVHSTEVAFSKSSYGQGPFAFSHSGHAACISLCFLLSSPSDLLARISDTSHLRIFIVSLHRAPLAADLRPVVPSRSPPLSIFRISVPMRQYLRLLLLPRLLASGSNSLPG
jgi:hypothetical protein